MLDLDHRLEAPMRHSSLFIVLLATLLLSADAAATLSVDRTAPLAYEILDLGSFDDGSSFATAINNAGTVVGQSSRGSAATAFVFRAGTMSTLGSALEETGGWATDINEAGVIVGGSFTAGGSSHAFVHSRGMTQDIGALGPDESSYATAINEHGVVVGASTFDGHLERPFRYHDGAMVNLGDVGNDRGHAFAADLNNAGLIVGAGDGENGSVGFYYDDRPATGGPVLLAEGVFEALAVNEAGQITGALVGPGAEARAFRLRGDTLDDLGPGEGLGINGQGDVVGWNAPGPFLAPVHGQSVQLDSLIPTDSGWQLIAASDINDRGWIVGWGFHNGVQRGFLLIPQH